MKFLFDLLPLIVFFGAFKLYGIYVATAASIVASIVQVVWFWFRHRRFETAQVVTLAAVVVFGGLTLAFHNDTFIKWKLTIIDWVFAVLILGSQWVGPRITVLERMLGKEMALPKPVWRRLNMSWGIFFLAVGALNLYIAFFYRIDLDPQVRQRMWVDFKVFWSTALMIIFSVVQAVVIASYLHKTEKSRR